MKNYFKLLYLIVALCTTTLYSADVIVKHDNSVPVKEYYTQSKNYYEESTILQPAGPCKVKKLQIYYSGNQVAKDTLYICNFPTAGGENGWKPTHYIWNYNTIVEPIIIEYDGVPGWKEINIESSNLQSDGFDKFVFQHFLRPEGPWFTYDGDGRNSGDYSWVNNPWNDYGASYSYPPGDYMIRLVVEYTYPDGEGSKSAPAEKFTNVCSITGLSPATDVAAIDFNNDGFDDLSMGSNIFLNNTNGTYSNVTNNLGLGGGSRMWADIDNDGDLDFYAMRNGSYYFDKAMIGNNDKVYINNNGSFHQAEPSEVFNKPYPNPNDEMGATGGFCDSIPNPYNTCTPMWLDYDGDGWVDLFIANKRIESNGHEIYFPDELWKNDGSGKLTNVRVSAGINGEPFVADDPNLYGWGYYDCYGAAACDYNSDGKTDIFVANYRLSPDNLYKNNGNGTFNDVAKSTGVRGEPTLVSYYFGHGMGCEWGDFNNDANPDLCVGNLGHPNRQGSYSNPSLIYENQGSPNFNFIDNRKRMGLKFHEGNAGVVWADFDNDGLLDLWHGKYDGGNGTFYKNTGAPDYKLKDMTWEYNCVVNSPWSAIRLDYDHDGDLDLVIKGSLFRNDIPRTGNWMSFRLKGSPENQVSNDCFGTRLIVYAGAKLFYRDLQGSASGTHCNQNSSELHFGIGDNLVADSIVIYYPNGKSNKFLNIKANAFYNIEYMKEPQQFGIATPGHIFPENKSFNIPSSVTCKWAKSNRATKYRFQYSLCTLDKGVTVPDTCNIIEDIITEDNQVTINNLIDNYNYYWHVAAINANDTTQFSGTWSFTVGIPVPNPPTLIYPAKDTTDITPYPTLKWLEATYQSGQMYSTKYKLQVSTDETFSTIYKEYNDLKSLSLTIIEKMTAGTKFYWRVAAINEETAGAWSDVWNFSIIPVPEKVMLKYPSNGLTEVKTKPKFTWEKTNYAVSYTLYIASDTIFSDTIAYYDEIETLYKVAVGMENDRKYFWKIMAKNESGNSDWSDIWSFETAKSNDVFENQNNLSFNIIGINPNPFNNILKIDLFMIERSNIEIHCYNSLGEAVGLVYSGFLEYGANQIEWSPNNLESGVYYIKVLSPKFNEIKKIVYIK